MKTKKIIAFSLFGIMALTSVAQTDSLYFGKTPPGIDPVKFASGIVTGYIHGMVAISPRGNEIYWVVTVENEVERLMFSKFENGTWTAPSVADFVKDDLTISNGMPVFSPDGEKLYFRSLRTGGMGGDDIWYVERTESGWGKPVNAGAPYNTTGWDLSPLFTKRNNAYCLRFNDKDIGSLLFFKYTNGIFSDPAAFDTITVFCPYSTVFISPEEDYLIFAIGTSNVDLYIRFKDKEGQWGTPINLGDKINTNQWDRFPVVSPDGKYLFFIRGKGAISDLYWVSTTFFDSLRNATTAGIGQWEEQKIGIFPNPTNGHFTLSFVTTPSKQATAEIYTTEGKLILVKTFQNTASATIDLSGFPKGMYVVKVIADGVSYKEKIILEK